MRSAPLGTPRTASRIRGSGCRRRAGARLDIVSLKRFIVGVNHPFTAPSPPAKSIFLQFYCTTVAQYTPPPPTPPFYGIHHSILVMAISCKGQHSQGAPALPCDGPVFRLGEPAFRLLKVPRVTRGSNPNVSDASFNRRRRLTRMAPLRGHAMIFSSGWENLHFVN